MGGQVVDQSNTAIPNVKIRWHYDDSSYPEAILGYTDASGNYSIPFTTRATLQGDAIEFVHASFTTVVAPGYTGDEAGGNLCGDVPLVRNVVLQP